MENSVIKKKVSALTNKEDLLALINELVMDELGEDRAFKFSSKQIGYYSNPNNIRGRYQHFSIPKKSGEERKISAPSKGLGNILYYVNIILKAIYRPSDYAMGFTEGKSVVDNAGRHIGQNYVFNTDLENFFPSIEQARVWKRFQLPPFNFNQTVANVLAGLCCMKEKYEDGSVKYVLPQGAPTSPLITNAICDILDRRLSGLARRFGLQYSRYADDITFSSMHNVYQENGEFRNELKRIIEDQHFHMKEAKTRLQKIGQRQEVTGLTVSTKVNVSKKYISEIRNLLHIWEKYGYTEVYKRFYPRYKAEKGYIKKGEPILENVLHGKLQYLKMVKGAKDPVYTNLQNRYDKLTSPVSAAIEQKLDYLRSFTLSEFEDIIGGKIAYALSKKGNLYGIASINNKSINIIITNSAKKKLVEEKIIEDESIVSAVSRIKAHAIATSKPGLYVVLAASNGHAPFWMMTYCDPTVSELDNSNIPVTNLIDIWEKEGITTAIEAFENSLLSETGSSNNDVSVFSQVINSELNNQNKTKTMTKNAKTYKRPFKKSNGFYGIVKKALNPDPQAALIAEVKKALNPDPQAALIAEVKNAMNPDPQAALIAEVKNAMNPDPQAALIAEVKKALNPDPQAALIAEVKNAMNPEPYKKIGSFKRVVKDKNKDDSISSVDYDTVKEELEEKNQYNHKTNSTKEHEQTQEGFSDEDVLLIDL